MTPSFDPIRLDSNDKIEVKTSLSLPISRERNNESFIQAPTYLTYLMVAMRCACLVHLTHQGISDNN